MTKSGHSWGDLFTPPALAAFPDLSFRARVWTIACVIAGSISAGFSGIWVVSGDYDQAFFDAAGSFCFLASGAHLQRTGQLRQSVHFACAAAFLLVLKSAFINDALSLPTLAWYGMIPLLASLALGRKSGLSWTLVVLPVPLLLSAAFQVGGWFSGPAIDPSQVVSLVILFSGLGAMTWTYETLNDQVRAERDQALASLQEALREAQEIIAARHQFVRNVSHEIRTPLNHILGATQLLGHTSLDDEQKDLVEMAETSGSDLLGIIDGALQVEDLERGNITLDLEWMDVSVLITRLSRRFGRPAMLKGLRLVTEVDPSLPRRLQGDLTRIEQILAHLIQNAVAFTESGTIYFRAHFRGKGRVHFEVEDTGSGIAVPDQDRIFLPFRQGDESDTRRHGGLGTGLALCRKLARLMGGDVTVSSREGAGSTFYVEVVLGEDHPHAPGLETASDPSRRREAKILLAEPNPVTRRGFLGTLSRMGCTADGVATQAELLERLSKETFDIVFVDLDLPGNTPISETLKAITSKPKRQGSCLVALSRSDVSGDLIPDGFDDQLPKPLRREQVLETLRRWGAPSRRGAG